MGDPGSPGSLSPVELVQSPATTATALHHHQFSSEWPSPEQQQGIAVLSTLNDSDIFSNLTYLRLVTPNLTNQQLGALASLRSAPDVYIKTWLEHGRRFSGVMVPNPIERFSLTRLYRQHPERAFLPL